jgi:cysteine desulfurase
MQKPMDSQLRGQPIYLDYQATTPLDVRVYDEMKRYYGEEFGNPHSLQHARGQRSRAAVERARKRVGQAIGASEQNILFTSGATEANNLAILGYVRGKRRRSPHIIVSAIEHQSVLAPARALMEQGCGVTFIKPDAGGIVSEDAVVAAMRPETILASVMAVNNEIGTIQPIERIGAACRKHGVAFHTDASQAVGVVPIDVESMNLDFVSLSAHKMYGPQGIGALYIREIDEPEIEPLVYGGGQEKGLRAGSLAAPLCAGLGKACELSRQEMAGNLETLGELSMRFIEIVSSTPGFFQNGHPVHRVPTNLNIGFSGITSEQLLRGLPDLELSVVSACASSAKGTSHVLSALGVSEEHMKCSIRVGFGRSTLIEEVERAGRLMASAVDSIRLRLRA